MRGWGTQTRTPAFGLQPSFTSTCYPVSQNKLRHQTWGESLAWQSLLLLWVDGATSPGPSWVFLAPVEDY